MLEHVETHNIISFYSASDPAVLKKSLYVNNWKPRHGLFRRFNGNMRLFLHSIKQSSSSESELSPAWDNAVDRLDTLKLPFSKTELTEYTNLRIAGLSDKTINWLKKQQIFSGDVQMARLVGLRLTIFEIMSQSNTAIFMQNGT
jgi:hypothetical protein